MWKFHALIKVFDFSDDEHSKNRLKDCEDEIIWSRNKDFGSYTMKVVYEVMMEDEVEGERKWWWKYVCNLNRNLKTRIVSIVNLM